MITALFALALFAPAALAQDDDAGVAASSASATANNDDFDYDEDDGGSASASAAASATAAAGDDDALPETGGPALLAPIAGAMLLAGGAASALALRRGRSDS